MNIIQNALFEVRRRVPEGILVAAFSQNDYASTTGGSFIRDFNSLQTNQGVIPVTLEYRIRQLIIEQRVRKDIDLVSGTQVIVPLEGLPGMWVDPYNVAYRIPKSLTQNRSISSVLSVAIGRGAMMGTTVMGMQGSSPMMDAMAGVLAAAGPIPQVSTAYVQLIDENTVLVQDNMALPPNLYLRCLLESDEMFSHIPPSAYQPFADMVELATKSFIYNRLVLPTDQARLMAGMELGRFRELIDQYADSEQLYRAFIVETWQAVSAMVDPESSRRYLRQIVGGLH